MKKLRTLLLLLLPAFLAGLAAGHYGFAPKAGVGKSAAHPSSKFIFPQAEVKPPPPSTALIPWDAKTPLGQALAGRLAEDRMKAVDVLVAQTPVAQLGTLLNQVPTAPRADDIFYVRKRAYAKWVATAPADAVQHAYTASLAQAQAGEDGKISYVGGDNPLGIALIAWAERDPQAALAKAQSAELALERGELVGAVLTTWAEADPTAALAATANMTTNEIRDAATIFPVVARRNPGAAVAAALNINEQWVQEDVLRQVFATWAALDLEAAWKGLDLIPHLPLRQMLAGDLLAYLAFKNPQEAFARWQALHRPHDDQFAVNRIFGAWAWRNPAAALAATHAIANDNVRNAAVSAIFSMWIKMQPDQAIAAFKQLPLGAKHAALASVVKSLVGHDPESALKLLAQVPSRGGGGRYNDNNWAYGDIFRSWAEQDPATAFAGALKLHLNPNDLNQALGGIFEIWAHSGDAAMLDAVAQIPTRASRNQVMNTVAEGLAENDPAGALAVLRQFDAAGLIKMTDYIQNVFQIWGRNDPENALAAAHDLPINKGGRQAMQAVFSNWMETDPPTAIAAYQQLDNATRVEIFQNSGGWQWDQAYSQWAANDPQAAFKSALTQANANVRDQSVVSVFRTWAGDDPQGAWAALDQIPNAGERRQAQTGIVQTMASNDPQSAWTMMQKIPPTQQDPNVYRDIFNNWAQKDPAEASAIAHNLPVGPARNNAIQSVVENWSSTDPAAAYAWAGNLTGTERSNALATVIDHMSQDDPANAATKLDEIPDNNRRNNLVQQIAGNWANTDPAAALAWLSTAASGGTYDSAVSNVLGQMGRNDPNGAAAYITQMADNSTKNSAIAALVGQWAPDDPQAALQWALALPVDGSSVTARQNALQTSLNAWANADPAAAAGYLNNLTADVGNLAALSGNVAAAWAKNNPQAALEWAAGLTDAASQTAALDKAITTVAATDPHAAWNFAANQPDTPARAAMETSIIAQWSNVEPSDAAKMLGNLPQTDALTKTTGTVARNWLQSDSVAASQWINTLAAGDARDSAVQEIVNTQARNDPEATFNWATTMNNPDTRYTSIQRVATQWASSDPQAALKAAQTVEGISDDQRQRLQQAVQRIIDNPSPTPGQRIYRSSGGAIIYN